MIRVVAAALIRDGTVLAARRRRPDGWEFPGGKVEPGETDEQALARECAEELGVQVEVGPRLDEAAGGGVRIVLYAARVTRGEPAPLEDHDELCWLPLARLRGVDWLPIDRELLDAVAVRLGE